MSKREQNMRRIVALSYDADVGPKVVYKTVETHADTLLQSNNNCYGTEVIKDEELARDLLHLPMQGEISLELYELLAQILVHFSEVEASMARNEKP